MKSNVTILILFLSINLLGQDNKVDWLKENVIIIDSLTNHSDFTDLMPLKNILSDKDIVFLGEGDHFHGSTLEAKNRLVRFLHQELGFDVLIFESGFYEGQVVNQEIGLSRDPIQTATQGFFMWPYLKQSKSLFSYIAESKKSDNPMSLAGFDSKVGTGRMKSEKFIKDFNVVMDSLNIEKTSFHYDLFIKCINKLYAEEFSDRPKGDTIEIFNNDLDKLISILDIQSESNETFSFWAQNILSIKNSLEYVWHFKKFSFPKLIVNLNEMYSLRDIRNANNLIWLIENKFKGKKVIVWSATAHLIHNIQTIKVKGIKSTVLNFKNFENTGDILWKMYGDRIYTIGFTSYVGEESNLTGSKIKFYKNDSKKNIEYSFHQLDQKYLFLDISNDNLPLWLKMKLMSGIVGYRREISIIPNTMDGIFYIDRMKLATYK